MRLPIDVVRPAGESQVSGTAPTLFRWIYSVDTPIGRRSVDQSGSLPPSMEGAVVELIALAKHQEMVIESLKEENRRLRESSGKADQPESAPRHTKRGRAEK